LKQKINLIKASMGIINPVTSEKLRQTEDIKNLSESLADLKKLRIEKNGRYNSEMRSAWGLDYCEITNVMSSCSRKTLGYVNFNGISLRHGSKSIGLGYVSQLGILQYFDHYKKMIEEFPSLSSITKEKGVIVLLRPPDSQHYSYALMNIYL